MTQSKVLGAYKRQEQEDILEALILKVGRTSLDGGSGLAVALTL